MGRNTNMLFHKGKSRGRADSECYSFGQLHGTFIPLIPPYLSSLISFSSFLFWALWAVSYQEAKPIQEWKEVAGFTFHQKAESSFTGISSAAFTSRFPVVRPKFDLPSLPTLVIARRILSIKHPLSGGCCLLQNYMGDVGRVTILTTFGFYQEEEREWMLVGNQYCLPCHDVTLVCMDQAWAVSQMDVGSVLE